MRHQPAARSDPGWPGPDPLRSRRFFLGGLAIGLVAMSAVGLATAVFIESPQQLAARSAAPPRTPIAATVSNAPIPARFALHCGAEIDQAAIRFPALSRPRAARPTPSSKKPEGSGTGLPRVKSELVAESMLGSESANQTCMLSGK